MTGEAHINHYCMTGGKGKHLLSTSETQFLWKLLMILADEELVE